MTLVFELSDGIESELRRDWPDLERHALEGLLIEAFREGKVGSSVVQSALVMVSRMEAINFLGDRGVYPGYGVEDLEADIATMKRLFNRSHPLTQAIPSE